MKKYKTQPTAQEDHEKLLAIACLNAELANEQVRDAISAARKIKIS